jgi:XTP/dITP diphosphohydrolase
MDTQPATMKLLLATKNRHKVDEIKALLADLDVEILCALDFPDLPDVVEDRDTIEGNAAKKAIECAAHTGIPALADDTGFFVDALDGRPGVFAARYAGPECSYADNRTKMLGEMQGVTNRAAHFRTAVVFATPDAIIATTIGEVTGSITHQEAGEGGFGYDPIFRADETGKTFGEMDAQAKHAISHRGRAMRAMLPHLQRFYGA